MKKIPSKLICQAYLFMALLVAAVMSPLVYAVTATALFLLLLLTRWRPLPTRANLAIRLAAVFILPLVLSPVLPVIAAVSSALPLFFLVDDSLKRSAVETSPAANRFSEVSRVLFTVVLMMLAVALILWSSVLFLTSVLLALYSGSVLALGFLALRRASLRIAVVTRRVLAGATIDVPLEASGNAGIHCRLTSAEPWLHISQSQLSFKDSGPIALHATATPPLAGPSRPRLNAVTTDSRGLAQKVQTLQPVELRVIPRARYAEWLATKYLEQLGTSVNASPETARLYKKGIEYFDSRVYTPGDSPRHIDWKHTFKMNQLIIKDFIEAGSQSAIIAVNLSVADAEAADKLAYKLVMTALTLAQENIPCALAAYNRNKVVQARTASDSREVLRECLKLVKDIQQAAPPVRCLQVPDIARLKRNRRLLQKATSVPAQKLLDLLDFEYRALELSARNHPAARALYATVKQTPPPATIIVISEKNDDAEALMVLTEKLKQRQFSTLSV